MDATMAAEARERVTKWIEDTRQLFALLPELLASDPQVNERISAAQKEVEKLKKEVEDLRKENHHLRLEKDDIAQAMGQVAAKLRIAPRKSPFDQLHVDRARLAEVAGDREEARGQRRRRHLEPVVGEPLPILRETLRVVLGDADPGARMREHPRLHGGLEDAGLRPQSGLRNRGDQHALDELRIELGEPPLGDEIAVEVRADGFPRAGRERLQAV